MPKTEYIYRDGSPVVDCKCVQPDHYVTTYIVRVRSMHPVPGNELKQIIQERLEVIRTPTITESICVVK